MRDMTHLEYRAGFMAHEALTHSKVGHRLIEYRAFLIAYRALLTYFFLPVT